MHEAADAVDFLQRMKEQEALVAACLNEAHAHRLRQLNSTRRPPPRLGPGSKVWYRPERQPGSDKLQPPYRGPCVVHSQVGQFSYMVEIAPGVLQHAHQSQLKRHIDDSLSRTPMPLHYFAGKAAELPEVGVDEWLVEGIDGHRVNSRGKLEFLTRWQHWDPSDRQWEPLGSFFPQYNPDLVKYCREKNLQVDLLSQFPRAP